MQPYQQEMSKSFIFRKQSLTWREGQLVLPTLFNKTKNCNADGVNIISIRQKITRRYIQWETFEYQKKQDIETPQGEFFPIKFLYYFNLGDDIFGFLKEFAKLCLEKF